MLHILRGSRPALAREIQRRYPSSGSVHLFIEQDFPTPWAGARALLAELRRKAGDEAIERAIAPFRAPLSLVLRRLEPLLTSEERTLRARIEPKLPGFLSHSRLSQTPLVEAWGGALSALLRSNPRPVVVPDVAAVDKETLAILRSLLRRLPAHELPEIVLGHVAPLGQASKRPAALEVPQLAMLEGLATSLVEHIDDIDGDETPPESPRPVPVDPWDDRAERIAWEALRAASSPLDDTVVNESIRAIRLAFGAFGFKAARQIGLELLGRKPTLTRALTAEAYTLFAVSVYNLKVRSGDQDLAVSLEHHFNVAFDAEDDPARRSHILYRLCTNAIRLPERSGQLGLDLSERAIEEARAPGVPAGEAAYLEAWARNGRAFLLNALRRPVEAARECERAATLLDDAAAQAGAPEREILGSRLVVCDNLAQVYTQLKEWQPAERWQEALGEADRALGDTMPYSWHRWVQIFRGQLRLKDAAEKAECGMTDAQRYGNPLAVDRFAADLGDLRYRLGDPADAHRCFLEVMAVRRRLGEPDELWRAEISASQAALRAGLLEEAEAGFRRALSSPACATSGGRAEILAALAATAAARGDTAMAEEQVNAAIAEAAATGQRGALVRTARAAGEVCLRLGAQADAREAFERAIELADAQIEEGDTVPSTAAVAAADQMGALLGAFRAGDDDPHRVLRALSLLPDALDDAEAWWDLPHLLDGVIRLTGSPALETPELRAALEVALRAGDQRPDTRERAAAIRVGLN